VTYAVDALTGIGAGCVVCSGWLFWMFWRSDRRAARTTKPGASSSRTVDGRTLGLVAMPGREQPASTPPQARPTRPGRATTKVSRPIGH
jgi:hypothetical protein